MPMIFASCVTFTSDSSEVEVAENTTENILVEESDSKVDIISSSKKYEDGEMYWLWSQDLIVPEENISRNEKLLNKYIKEESSLKWELWKLESFLANESSNKMPFKVKLTTNKRIKEVSSRLDRIGQILLALENKEEIIDLENWTVLLKKDLQESMKEDKVREKKMNEMYEKCKSEKDEIQRWLCHEKWTKKINRGW